MREDIRNRMINLLATLRTCEREISFFADMFDISDEDNAEYDEEYQAFDELWDAGSCVSEAAELLEEVLEAYRNGTLKEHDNGKTDEEGTEARGGKSLQAGEEARKQPDGA